MNVLIRSVFALLLSASVAFSTDITSSATGAWNATGTWVGGVVPTASDNVVIATGHTVTVTSADAECNDITANGFLYFDLTASGGKLIVHGNASVGSTGRIRSGSGTPAAARAHELYLEKNLTVATGGSFDMRVGSGVTVSVARVVFSGSTSSTISLSQTTYGSSVEEFNSVIIDKSGGAKVILASGNLFQNNNSTNSPDTLIFISGLIETGSNHWVNLRTSSFAFVGASPSSYVNGILGRGISNGGGLGNVDFPLGDGVTYRPINAKMIAPANATGHYVWATVRTGNANTGSSTLLGGIDMVSAIRYFEIGYLKNAGTADTMKFYSFGPSYGTDDGVLAGNTDLRVAYSTDARASWINNGPLSHSTDLSNPPTTINGDSLTTSIPIFTGTTLFVSLANASGGVNPLPIQLASFTATAVGVRSVRLDWTTISEVNNYGFHVQRKTGSIWQRISLNVIPGGGTTNTPHHYSFVDNEAPIQAWYRLEQIDLDGTTHYTEPIELVSPTGVTENVPFEFSLQQNYPNPFNPATTIKFSVDKTAKAVVDVYNLVGAKVVTLFDGVAVAGSLYQVQLNATSLSSGVYFYRLNSGGNMLCKRMVVLK